MHLFCDNCEWIFIFRKEVEDAPDSEGVFFRHEQIHGVDVLRRRQSPAHLIELDEVKVGLDLPLKHKNKNNKLILIL